MSSLHAALLCSVILRERGTKRDGERCGIQSVRVCVCVCVFVFCTKVPYGLFHRYAAMTYCKLIGMSEQNRGQFLRRYFTMQEEQDLLHR